MIQLTELPTETLLLVLEFLSRIDLATFLRCQTTSRIFRLLVRDILSVQSSTPTSTSLPDHVSDSTEFPISPLLWYNFRPLFQSAACFTPDERRRMRVLTLDGDYNRPFRRLLWSKGTTRRECYLRAEASWRQLSITCGGGPPITHLDIVKSYSSEDFNEDGRDHIQYLQADFGAYTPDHIVHPMTMGDLYNLLLCGGRVGDAGAVTFGDETGSWELLVGSRLRSYDTLFEYECFIPSDDALVDRGPEADQSAILYVRGGTVELDDQDRRFAEPEDEGSGGWTPEIFGQTPKLLPWQGPEPNIFRIEDE